MRVLDLPQGSAEWLEARAGSLGASQVHDALAMTRSGWAASRENLMARLAVERITGKPVDTFTTPAMQHGHVWEASARSAYAFAHDVDVAEVGLVLHPTIAGTHASPDGLVGECGLVEIKCPQHAKHMETLLSEAIDGRYMRQMQWQMACTGRAWCDFVSFQPDFPGEMQLWVKRVERDGEAIEEYEREVRIFLDDLDAKVEALRARYMEQAA